MNLDRIANIAGGFFTLATATVVLSSPETANILREVFGGLRDNLVAAMGGGSGGRAVSGRRR